MDKEQIRRRYQAVKSAEQALNRFDTEHPGVNASGGNASPDLKAERAKLGSILADMCMSFADYFCRRHESEFKALFGIEEEQS